jgi:hypothetical protein
MLIAIHKDAKECGPLGIELLKHGVARNAVKEKDLIDLMNDLPYLFYSIYFTS